MASYPLPPWLAPVNPVPYAVQGFQQGESIAERQNRAELAIQEMTLRREQQQRLQEQANQEMAIQQQAAQERAKQAALKWQWQQELSGRVAKGEDPMKAWEATSTKYNPAGMADYWHQKETTRMAEQRAAAAQKHQQAMESRPTFMGTPQGGIVSIDPQTGTVKSIYEGTRPKPLEPIQEAWKQRLGSRIEALYKQAAGIDKESLGLPESEVMAKKQAMAKLISGHEKLLDRMLKGESVNIPNEMARIGLENEPTTGFTAKGEKRFLFPQPIDLPTKNGKVDRDSLITGQPYMTSKGVLMWNGKQYVTWSGQPSPSTLQPPPTTSVSDEEDTE